MSNPPATSASPFAAPTALLTGPGVWMEGDATEQLAAVAELEGCVRVAGMPDLHPGRGYPIGAVVATRDVIHPQLIGGDAGCGARVIATSIERFAPDPLERRLRAGFAAAVVDDADPAALFAAAWTRGARGLADVDGLPDGLRALAAREPELDELPASGDPARFAPGFAQVLGTIGGGNHFAELARVDDVRDPDVAASAGLTRNALVVVAHSGSRGLGTALGGHWGARPLRAEHRATYLGELAGACRFARANRLVVAYRVLAALGAVRAHTLRGGFDVTHNDVRAEVVDGGDAWVHRKGAAPAAADALTIVLGSRGAPSWIMRGTGAPAGLSSVAHGAGRKMKRGEALDKLRARYRRAQLARAPGGGRVICDDPALLFEEHPDAYKPIAPVIDALEHHHLATRVAALWPVMTVKL